MEIKTVSYRKTFNLGNYQNEQIGIEISVGPNDDPIEVFAAAKRHVEKSHLFFQDLPAYEKAKSISKDTDNHTGIQVKQAEKIVETFEANFPEFIGPFMPPERQLNGPPRTFGHEDDDN